MSTLLVNDVVRLSRNCEKVKDFESLKRWVFFWQFGVSPVFVVDETPLPMKSHARIARFFLFSGVDIPGLLVAEKGFSVERKRLF